MGVLIFWLAVLFALTAAGWFLLRWMLSGSGAEQAGKRAAQLVSLQAVAAFGGFWLGALSANEVFLGQGEKGIVLVFLAAFIATWLTPLLAGAWYLRGKTAGISWLKRGWAVCLMPLLWAVLLVLGTLVA